VNRFPSRAGRRGLDCCRPWVPRPRTRGVPTTSLARAVPRFESTPGAATREAASRDPITRALPLPTPCCSTWFCASLHSAQGWSAYKEAVGGSSPSAPTSMCRKGRAIRARTRAGCTALEEWIPRDRSLSDASRLGLPPSGEVTLGEEAGSHQIGSTCRSVGVQRAWCRFALQRRPAMPTGGPHVS
jgi:hypothetical protein